MTATTLNEFSMAHARGTMPDRESSPVQQRKPRWAPRHIPFGDVSVPERPNLPKGSVAPIL